jgi:hypothetical protein
MRIILTAQIVRKNDYYSKMIGMLMIFLENVRSMINLVVKSCLVDRACAQSLKKNY